MTPKELYLRKQYQKQWRARKFEQGWKWSPSIILPAEVHTKLMEYKKELMEVWKSEHKAEMETERSKNLCKVWKERKGEAVTA